MTQQGCLSSRAAASGSGHPTNATNGFRISLTHTEISTCLKSALSTLQHAIQHPDKVFDLSPAGIIQQVQPQKAMVMLRIKTVPTVVHRVGICHAEGQVMRRDS